MRSDGGGEYIGHFFQNWLAQPRIAHEATTAYSPDSNGQAKCLNWTMLDIARTVMHRVPIEPGNLLQKQ